MYILFLDESGTPPANATGPQRYFVIGGLVIPSTEWRNVYNRLQGLKTRHGIRGELKWRYFAPGNTDIANPMRAMTFADRDAIRREALAIIPAVPSIRVIAAIASVSACFGMRSITTPDDIYSLTYKTVTERFQYFLQDLSKQTGDQECGMVVSDHRSATSDRALRAHHHRLLAGPGLFVSKYNNLIETLFFAPSHLSTGLQFADLVAGSIWQRFERGKDDCYRIFERSVRRNAAGIADGYGLIKVPKLGWV